jgi:hypothetical protein
VSTYLSVNIAELEALVRDLKALQRGLQTAVTSSARAMKTASWNGPAADRYVSEMGEHTAKLRAAADDVEAAIAAVQGDIALAREAKAEEQRRLQRLRDAEDA